MQLSFTEKKNVRKSFGKLAETLSIPNLIEVQKNSYKQLTDFDSDAGDLTKGFDRVFKGIFPIEDLNDKATLEYVSYRLEKPKFDTEECIQRGLSFMDEIKNNLPELPDEKERRFIEESNLDVSEAKIIASSKTMANMFDEACDKTDDAKLIANWLVGDISALLNKDNIDLEESKLTSSNFAVLIERISDKTISGKIAKSVLEEVWESGRNVDEIIENKGLVQIQDESLLEEIALKIIENNPSQVEAYKSGKDKLFGFFVGQVMKETQGKANPQSVNEILRKLLG